MVNNTIKTLSDNPEYFGGYLNMARHNIFLICNYVAEKLEKKTLNNDSEIKNSFLCKYKEEKNIDWPHTFAIIERYMPIVKLFDDENYKENKDVKSKGKDFKGMSYTLSRLFEELIYFRNSYSHYATFEDNTIKRKTHLNYDLSDSLSYAIRKTKIRFKDTFKEEDFDYIEKKLSLYNNVNTQEINEIGFVFFISMFLTREQAFQMIGKIKGLKGTHINSYKATREVLMAYCVKSPKEKLKSDDEKQALILDIINELNRCPKELYNVITEENKKEFSSQISDSAKGKIIEASLNEEQINELDNYDSYIEEISKRIRYRDRFTEFALKFIDTQNILPKINFQIELGKLKIDEYQKEIGDDKETRTIVVNPKKYSKLSNIKEENEELDYLKKKKKYLDKNIIFDNFYPHYNVKNNKIGISYKRNEASLSTHELYKIILLEYLEKGTAENIIKKFIENNNNFIYNKEFIESIKNKLNWGEFRLRTDIKNKNAYKNAYDKENINELLKRKNRINELLKDKNLDCKQIPTRIVNYWLNASDVDNDFKISNRIKAEKENCKRRIKQLEKGKIKIGDMASYLARDIVDMIIDEDKKKKITSFYYKKMQECLALYADEKKRELFFTIITKELKLNEKGGHPFLFNIIKKSNSFDYTQDFYKAYVSEKGNKIYNNKNTSWLVKNFYTFNRKNKKTEVKLTYDKSKLPLTYIKWGKKVVSKTG